MNPQQDNSPTLEILAYAVQELTKDWDNKKQEEFSKHCFDTVCQKRYNERKRFPKMNISYIHKMKD